MSIFGVIFVSILLVKTEAFNETVPHWKDLECQVTLLINGSFLHSLSVFVLSDWSQVPVF